MKKINKNTSENFLDKVPVIARDLDWDIIDGVVVVHQQNKGFYAKIAQKFFKTPETSHIRLDDFGTYVWQCIDGKSNVHEIGKKVEKEFGKKAEPLYERLSQFMETLSRVHYIEFVTAEKDA